MRVNYFENLQLRSVIKLNSVLWSTPPMVTILSSIFKRSWTNGPQTLIHVSFKLNLKKKNKLKKRSVCSEIKHLRQQKHFENNYIKPRLKTSAVEKSVRKIRDQLTFCSIRYFTERNDPKNIGKSAIKTKLEYATNNPSGVAAALPVTFLAVSFTVAERFATVSFTTDSAILTERERPFVWRQPAIP